MHTKLTYLLAGLALILLSVACTPSRIVQEPASVSGLKPSDVTAESILSQIPDFSDSLHAVRGKGKAIVSEPGNNERVTVIFASDRHKSLVTIRNGIGIEGGKLLAEGDSLLIYNKLDKVAHKVPVSGGRLSGLDHLASANILELLNFTAEPGQAERVLESDRFYMLRLRDGSEVYIGRDDHTVQRVDRPPTSKAPYSRILYDAYGNIDGYQLPRRVTIFSADRTAKVALLIQSLEVNPENLKMSVNIPDEINIIRQ